MTTVTIGGTDINYSDFEISVPVSTAGVAPTATIVSNARETVTANDTVTISINGSVVFDGVAQSAGTKSNLGGRRINCEHRAVEFFEEKISLDVTGRSSGGILADAQSASDSGAGFTLTVVPTGATLDYSVENRPVKRVFRDICDRNGWVWWVDPATDTITVDTVGGRGTWQSLDAEADGISVDQFDSGNVDTVRNKVTVVGTGEQKVEATANDSTSQSTYGTRTGESPYNVSYITTQAEATNMADALLVPDPLAEGKITVPRTVGDIASPLVNYTLDLTDTAKDIAATGLLIEKQTIEQGRATLQIGQGNGESIAEFNRRSKSQSDTFEGDDLSKIAGTLDDVNDGQQWGRILTSAIQNGVHTLSDAAGDLDNIDDGGTYARVRSGNVDADNYVLLATSRGDLDDIDDGDNYGKVLTTALDAGNIVLGEAVGDIDDIKDGETYGKVKITNLTPGGAVFASGVELGPDRNLDDITTEDIDKGNATVIDGGEILTSSLTAQEIDALDLDTNQLTIGQPDAGDNRYFEFGVQVSFLGDEAFMRPAANGSVNIGQSSQRFRIGYFSSVNTGELYPQSGATSNVGRSASPFDEAYITTVEADSVDPINGDANGQVGNVNTAWSDMYAYNFIDADTGSALSDGGNVLANLKRGQRPPEHARARDPETGDEVGIKLNNLTKHLWEVCTAQQDRLEAAEQRIDELEQRLSTLESQM